MKEKIIFPGSTCELASVRSQIRTFLDDQGFGECESTLIVLALDEACTNIIRHAYDNACKPIRMEMTALRDRVRFVLRDYGRTCCPKKIRSRKLEDIRPGGLGVHIIHQAFDSVEYAPQRRGTKLTLERRLP